MAFRSYKIYNHHTQATPVPSLYGTIDGKNGQSAVPILTSGAPRMGIPAPVYKNQRPSRFGPPVAGPASMRRVQPPTPAAMAPPPSEPVPRGCPKNRPKHIDPRADMPDASQPADVLSADCRHYTHTRVNLFPGSGGLSGQIVGDKIVPPTFERVAPKPVPKVHDPLVQEDYNAVGRFAGRSAPSAIPPDVPSPGVPDQHVQPRPLK